MRKADRVEDGPECGRCHATNDPRRSFCRKCGCWLHPKPLARPSKPIARSTTRIAPFSARRLTEREQRAVVVRIVQERDRVCQAGAAHALVHGLSCGGPLDVHELIPRSQWAQGYLVVENCLLVCRNSHDWITTHAYGAHAIGLRRWSWEGVHDI